MLQLRPNCEYCDKDLAPGATDAMICSYECTFCADCVGEHLHNVCPNCGGGFSMRPIRPMKARQGGYRRFRGRPEGSAASRALSVRTGEAQALDKPCCIAFPPIGIVDGDRR